MSNRCGKTIAVILSLILILAFFVPSSFAEDSGMRFVSLGQSGLSVFLPDGFTEIELADSARDSGYTAQYALDGLSFGVGAWAVSDGYTFQEELNYSREKYGDENVFEVIIHDTRVIMCEIDSGKTLMLVYPDENGYVHFIVASPVDSPLQFALVQSIFYSLTSENPQFVSESDNEQTDTGESSVIALGEGSKSFVAMVNVNGENVIYQINTDRKFLLDALTDIGFVAGEKVSWGYNVTTVADYYADYETDGAYWQIMYFDNSITDWVPLDTSIEYTVLPDAEGDNLVAYGFFLSY